MAALGAVEIVARGGKQCLEGSSVAIAETWAQVRKAGFSDALGFGTHDLALYVEMAQWLAREELRRFASRVAAKVDPETARRMAQEGIDGMNQLIGLLREAILLRSIADGNLAAQTSEAG